MWNPLLDIRYGFRELLRNKGFATTALGSLALGILASTVMYSVLYGIVINPFPYKDVGSLMSIKVWNPQQRGWRTGYAVDEFLEIAARATIFDGVIASTISDVVWQDQGEPQRLRGNHVTPNTFEVMGVAPLFGRVVQSNDPDPESTVILGFRFWNRQFGANPNVIGSRLTLNGKVRTVIGIMPKRFMWRGADVYLPLLYQRGGANEGVRYVHVLGRLKPGVTDARAEADLRPIIEELKRRNPQNYPDTWRVGLLSFEETFPSGIRDTLWVMLGAVLLLLLIACANVSHMMLARAASREREVAVRAAIGAGKGQLIRQFLTESLLIALSGGVLGVLGAYGGLKLVLAILPPGVVPDESEILLNRPVLLFSLLASVATALLFGLAPALHASGVNFATALRSAGRSSASRGSRLFRSSLAVVEIALACVLLTGTAVLLRALIGMERTPVGARIDNQLTLRVPLSEQRYPEPSRRIAFFEELLPRLRALPGVDGAGLNLGVHPFGFWDLPVQIPGFGQADPRPVVLHAVDTGYMHAFAIGLLSGRAIDTHDIAAARHVAIANQAFVERYFPALNPLGRTVRFPRLEQPPFAVGDSGFEIIGVARNAIYDFESGAARPEIYTPYTVLALSDRVVVHTQGDPMAMANAVRAQVYAIDRNQPVTDVKSLDSLLEDWVFARPRFRTALFSVFGGLGLALALLGVYGILGYGVAEQRREFGVRIAVGAATGQVLRLVLYRGLRLIALGIALGLALGLVLMRALPRFLDLPAGIDPVAFAAVALTLTFAGIAATLQPALRAARIDPIQTLRSE